MKMFHLLLFCLDKVSEDLIFPFATLSAPLALLTCDVFLSVSLADSMSSGAPSSTSCWAVSIQRLLTPLYRAAFSHMLIRLQVFLTRGRLVCVPWTDRT